MAAKSPLLTAGHGFIDPPHKFLVVHTQSEREIEFSKVRIVHNPNGLSQMVVRLVRSLFQSIQYHHKGNNSFR